MQNQGFSQLMFKEAASIWLASRSRISERTRRDYMEYLRRLLPIFGETRLCDVSINQLGQYRTMRQQTAGASRINHEINMLQQVLKRAGFWGAIAPWYEPLPVPRSGPGRALDPEEEERLFRTAAENPRWRVAFCAALTTANTTVGPGEIRLLRLKDVSLKDRMLHVREGAKNRFRIRSVPLNDDALWAVNELMKRAQQMGATEPEHYLLPHRAHTSGSAPDPTRPMGSWKKAWYALRNAAALPGLRAYDLRHHAITCLLENPQVSEQTIKDIAGHVSKNMLERYSHIRLKAKRDALAGLSARHIHRLPETVPNRRFIFLGQQDGKACG